MITAAVANPRSSASPTCFELTLTPVFNHTADLSALAVHQRLTNYAFAQDEDVLSLLVDLGGVDMGYVAADGPTVSDAEGAIELVDRFESTVLTSTRIWKTLRPTVGDIEVVYTALPRPVSAATRTGPSLDFRLDQGGLIGSGMGFLALPPDREGGEVSATISVDLSGHQRDVSAAWTYGGGEGVVQIEGETVFGRIANTFWAVGPVKSLESPSSSAKLNDFNMYWFGEPPFDPFELGSRLGTVFAEMRSFFRDTGDTYRIFLRHNPFPGSLTGTALHRSFMHGYDDSERAYPPTLQDREAVLVHEMVHNWVSLEGAESLSSENWYSEGLADYYAVLLRYRLGLLDPREYLEEVNRRLVGYYTSPAVAWSWEHLLEATWLISHAQEMPYARGFAMGLKVNGLIRRASGGAASLDDLVVTLVARLQRGERHGLREYLDLLTDVLHDEELPTALVDDMKAGELQIPSEDCLDPLPFHTRLVSQQLEVFELGFAEKALLAGNHTIEGLVAGSRAELAGLRNGDRVHMLYGSAYHHAKGNFEARLTLEVQRVGWEPFVVDFWPRSRERALAYMFVEVEDEL
ncbi:hypothetical protein LTR36_006426 [Oleoguttula mirabilis]|uniref:Peptidase M61 catalytic domain-containing protein n=1 Tax=Oleoguttula mirabilis TaxID=1507867 RepID=A0AAV9JV14_9PEZI|nr:hypothetical protein LTR36_006426 [Oleoguttula mirabilis]